MKVSLNWLKDFIDIEMSPEELAHLLTMSGLEVEGLESRGQSLEGVVVSKILSIDAHPNADKLSICTVDTGKGEAQIVCGAPNLSLGSLVPLALPGARLPAGMVIKKSRIRGEQSMGMLLAEDEMGLTDDHSGIMILPENLEPGTPVTESLQLKDSTLEIGLTPNRPDCASVIGIAREIAALTGGALRVPEIDFKESDPPIQDLTSVSIEDPEGCPRYAAGIIQEFKIGPSPFWLRYRLIQAGIRSINNVVDVTNYVMLELGQPLHAFDYDRLRENRIVVRRAESGENFTTLDGNRHRLRADHLMICDGKGPVALAGIMGGVNSEIVAESRNVLIESACFDPMIIRRGAKSLGIATEASYRFERGTDIEGVVPSLKRAMMFINQLAGGNIAKGIIDNYPRPHEKRNIDFRVEKANKYLGTTSSDQEMKGYLQSLEMEVKKKGKDVFVVKPPSFRVDITREVDLFEEVARMIGYDNIQVTSPYIRPMDQLYPREMRLQDEIKEIMVGFGFSEIITYSFISPDSIEWLEISNKNPLRSFVKLLNPLNRDQSVMRTSLIPGLLMTAKNNIAYGEYNLKLFEIGKTFFYRRAEKLPEEKTCLTAILSGLAVKKEWFNQERSVDFFDIKGVLEGLLKELYIYEYQLRREDLPSYLDIERAAGIHVDESHLGWLGQLSDKVKANYDFEGSSPYLLELDLEELAKVLPETVTFKPFARYPGVFRDISIVVDKEIRSGRIKQAIEQVNTDLIESISLYDHYEGERIGADEKALTFRILYRSKDRTLSGKEINELHESVIRKIQDETGGRLRDG